MGLDNIQSDPRFNFLSFFTNEDNDDSVPDSFFINSQCSPYTDINLNCSYLETEKIKDLDPTKFTVLSINIQSLPSKFSEFSDFVDEFSCSDASPDIICLQETWKVLDNSMFPLLNYHPIEINQRQVARGGGVGIYVKQHLSFKILKQYSTFVERIFESLFIEISLPNSKKVVIGNIYRPGTAVPGLNFTQQFAQFFEIFSNTLAELGNNY